MKVLFVKRIQFNTKRETPLQLWNKIAWSGNTKCTRRNKKNMRSVYHSKFRVHVTAFHNWKNVPLHTLATHILSMTFPVNCNFIDFVNKNNSALFNALFSNFTHFVSVNHAVKRFFCNNFSRLTNGNRSFFARIARQYAGKILHAVLKIVYIAPCNYFHAWHALPSVKDNFNLSLLQFSFTQQ